MKKIFISFFVLSLMFFIAGFVNAQNEEITSEKIDEKTETSLLADWINVGAPGFSAEVIRGISLALDFNNIPYVAYDPTNSKAVVKKFNGASWVDVGAPGFSAGKTENISIVFNSTKTIPYVAYSDGANSWKTTVMKYDGANWVNVGNPGFSAGRAISTSLALDSNNVPYVAYSDGGNNWKVTVMKYNSASNNWENVGKPGFSAGLGDFISLKVDSNNVPYVAYRDTANKYKATVMKWNGVNWIPVGAPGFSAGSAQQKSLAINSKNIPYLAYQDWGNSGKAIVMKYDGAGWVSVGTPGFSGGVIDYPSLAFNSSDVPFVSFKDLANNRKITVMKYNSASNNWENVGNPGFSAGIVHDTSLAISSNGIPYVAFRDVANGIKATVMKYVPPVPSFMILSPNGGEIFTAGQQFTAVWTSSGFPPTSPLYFGLFQDKTNIWYSLTNQTFNDGTEVFTIPANIQPGQYKMYGRFTGTAIEDFSDNSFTIN